MRLKQLLMPVGERLRAYEEQVAARTLFDSIGLRVWDSEVLRMTAEARMAAGADGLDEADTLLAEASTIAAMQGAFMLSLRVEQTRARLDLAHDRQEGAWERLSTALSRLPEREASQTAEATALLQRLAPSRRPGPAR